LNNREKGFLLLTSHLGSPHRKVLTVAQFRTLADRMRYMEKPTEDWELGEKDIVNLGYNREMAARMLSLLEEEALLRHYCSRGKKLGCHPVTRVSDGYPGILRLRLGLDSPGCLWAKGDLSLMKAPCIALVGSRDLRPENRAFAEAVGRMAAERGLVLVSGNARGADRAAQEACLAAGGQIVSIVADELGKQMLRKNVLYISEDGFDEPFSAQRALSRNRLIHALGRTVFVSQSSLRKGGTWAGTVNNLQSSLSTVACFRDGSAASKELERLGAYLVDMDDLKDFSLPAEELTLFYTDS